MVLHVHGMCTAACDWQCQRLQYSFGQGNLQLDIAAAHTRYAHDGVRLLHNGIPLQALQP
jgi:hypothetical protein